MNKMEDDRVLKLAESQDESAMASFQMKKKEDGDKFFEGGEEEEQSA